MIDKAFLVGHISDYGVKLAYSESAKPQLTCTVVCEEPGMRDGQTFTAYIPLLVVGPHTEALAEILEPGDVVLLEGKLAYKAGKPNDASKLMVVCFGVQRLLPAILASHEGADA